MSTLAGAALGELLTFQRQSRLMVKANNNDNSNSKSNNNNNSDNNDNDNNNSNDIALKWSHKDAAPDLAAPSLCSSGVT